MIKNNRRLLQSPERAPSIGEGRSPPILTPSFCGAQIKIKKNPPFLKSDKF